MISVNITTTPQIDAPNLHHEISCNEILSNFEFSWIFSLILLQKTDLLKSENLMCFSTIYLEAFEPK